MFGSNRFSAGLSGFDVFGWWSSGVGRNFQGLVEPCSVCGLGRDLGVMVDQIHLNIPGVASHIGSVIRRAASGEPLIRAARRHVSELAH